MQSYLPLQQLIEPGREVRHTTWSCPGQAARQATGCGAHRSLSTLALSLLFQHQSCPVCWSASTTAVLQCQIGPRGILWTAQHCMAVPGTAEACDKASRCMELTRRRLWR